MKTLQRVSGWLFWQRELAAVADTFLWTVIVIVLSAYGSTILWYLGYSPWLYILVPAGIQALFAWHHSLMDAVAARNAAHAMVDGLIRLSHDSAGEDTVTGEFDLTNVLLFPGGYLPVSE
jgi:hypothetical protein